MNIKYFFAIILIASVLMPAVVLAEPGLDNTEVCPAGTAAECTCKPGLGQTASVSTACGHGACCRNMCGGTDQVKKFECAKPEAASDTITPLYTPTTQVIIPGLTFTKTLDLKDGADGLRFYEVPWIAEYINAVYRWGVGIAGVLAVIMVIVGGLTWMTAGGNSGQVETAKTYIIGALTGLVLALGSYTILWLVNPELVKLKPLSIPYVERLSLEIAESEPENMAAEKTGNLSSVGDRKTTEYIVIHTAAGLQSRDQVDAFHRSKGWAGIGYNFYVERDGRWVEGRGENKTGAHAVGYNSKSIGISYAGCVKHQQANQPLATALEKETITQTQLDTLIEHIKQLQAKYHIPRDKVVDHRETGAPKACSCLNMDEIRAKINP